MLKEFKMNLVIKKNLDVKLLGKVILSIYDFEVLNYQCTEQKFPCTA
jgi:hypothetical protein